MKCVLLLAAAMIVSSLFNSCSSSSITGGSFYADCEKYSTGDFSYAADEVKTVSIDWISGIVDVYSSENDTLNVTEECSGSLGAECRMHWRLKEKEKSLDIQYCESGLTFSTDTVKRLTVEIPDGINLHIAITSGEAKLHDHRLENLEVTSTSGNIGADILTASQILLSSTSGNISIRDSITTKDINANSTSGNISLGEVSTDMLILSSISGKCGVSLSKCSNAEFDTTSGDFTLKLNGQGASILHSTVSGKFSADDYSISEDRYIFGDGSCSIAASTVSGDFKVIQ